MTLNGIDVSRYNAASQIASWLPHIDFGLVWDSQGTYLSGLSHAAQVAQLRAAGKRVGHYHYAWLSNGGAASANYFLNTANAQPGDVLALDYEPFNQDDSHGAQYVVDFAQTVRARTGCWPWLYSEDYHLKRLTSTASASQLAVIHSLPLWKAGYSNGYFHLSSAPAFTGSIYGWPAITGWQWSDVPLDLDVFFGSTATWDALAIPRPHATPSTPAYSPIPPALTVGGTSPIQEDEMKLITAPGRPWAILYSNGALQTVRGGTPASFYAALGLTPNPAVIPAANFDDIKATSDALLRKV
jgi:GH25 family lysozyme M1 (1,4-beta-N-acetylmuramidase)